MSYVNILHIGWTSNFHTFLSASGKLTVFHMNWNSLSRALTWIYNILFLLNTKCTTKHSLGQFFKSDFDHWRSDHSNIKSYLSHCKSNLGQWRSDYSDFKSYLSHYKSDLGHWKSDRSNFKSDLSHYKTDIGQWRSDHIHFKGYPSYNKGDFGHKKVVSATEKNI